MEKRKTNRRGRESACLIFQKFETERKNVKGLSSQLCYSAVFYFILFLSSLHILQQKVVMIIYVHFLDAAGEFLEPNDTDSGIPEGVVSLEILGRRLFDNDDENVCNGYSYDSKIFLEMLKKTPSKMKKITLDFIEANMDPEYLELLVSTFNKADSLTLVDLVGSAGYSCLKSCFLQRNGPRELQFDPIKRVSTSHARLLFEGLASSSTIESFVLSPSGNLVFVDAEEAGRAFVSALQQNRSLKHIQFHYDHFQTVLQWPRSQTFPEIFKAAVLDTKVRSLDIRQATQFGQARLDFEIFLETLCRSDCSLEELRMSAVAFWPPEDDAPMHDSSSLPQEISTPNTSLRIVCMNETGLDSPRIMETVGLMKSIVSLDLRGNSISTLDPLESLLIGDNLTLQCLKLDENRIEEAEAVAFLRKLPQMTCLKHMSMSSNPFFWSRSYMDILAIVVWQNKSLEGIRFEANDVCPQLEALYSQISVPLSWNRGGRRTLDSSPSDESLPANLWPKVLQRATRISYYNYDDEWQSPSSENTKVDVVYWFLKKKLLGEWIS